MNIGNTNNDMSNTVEIIKFNEVELLCTVIDGVPYTAIKPLCEAIGLNYSSAYTSIKNDEILKEVYAVRHMDDASGKVREMICMPIQHIHGWLFSIQASKVRKDVQPKLILFKRECYAVLFNHFYGKNKSINTNLEERYLLGEYKKKLSRLINKLLNRHKEIEKRIELLDSQNYQQLGLFSLPVGKAVAKLEEEPNADELIKGLKRRHKIKQA